MLSAVLLNHPGGGGHHPGGGGGHRHHHGGGGGGGWYPGYAPAPYYDLEVVSPQCRYQLTLETGQTAVVVGPCPTPLTKQTRAIITPL